MSVANYERHIIAAIRSLEAAKSETQNSNARRLLEAIAEGLRYAPIRPPVFDVKAKP